jgi:UDP-N-acetylglucosamine 4,6-dehydratase
MTSLASQLRNMSRARKRRLLIVYDAVAMMIALWSSLSARLGEFYLPDNPTIIVAAAASVFLGLVSLYFLQIYRIVLRFFDLDTISRILFGAAIAAAAWIMITYFLRPTMIDNGQTIFVPRSIGLIYCGFLFMLLFVGRYFMALLVVGIDHRDRRQSPGEKTTVAIYGANAVGVSLAESVQRHVKYKLCAFVDDDPALHGQVAAGKPIYSPDELPELVREKEIREVFLAIPQASRAERLAVVSRLSDLGVEIKTVPGPEEIVSGRYTVTDIRPVHVNDLLRREPVKPLTGLIQQSVEGCSILITGAGGSIGSEICRQIIRGEPQKMVLLDHSEFALYTIEQQLIDLLKSRSGKAPEIVPIIGSILNESLVRELIRTEQIDSIYHAAAYKHVPLLERNEIAGVENNIFGTLIVATAALDAGLTRFIMISTDKAVRPENLMGASKRVAELIVQAYARRSDDTRFGIVRFGNVLDSSGSVVQLFRRQILSGGPVTVTHRDITRFFMSIPEATQLVLQASAMASSGEVFVLDMGEPVRIDDLARNMIRLSGMTVRDSDNPDGDIEITYVGIRPGEKLYEELFIGGEVVPTEHPRIRKAMERSVPFKELNQHLTILREAIGGRDVSTVRDVLRSVIAPDEAFINSSEKQPDPDKVVRISAKK